MGQRGGASSLTLAPYVPRLALEWAESSPDQTWRAVDGSLVFVDISGFTALSERLARRGRHGAEELTSTLSACFADLLAVAYAAGGSLLKFGGDALLLLFDGPGHAVRAATSALNMRSTMATAGRVTTSVGNVRLRMSVGVHSGPVHLFRVGGSHRELIVSGPGVSTTVDMEATASAGEIVVSWATAAQINPSLVGAAKGPGLLLRKRAVDMPERSFPPAPIPRVDVGVAIPVALRAHLAGAVDPEHRQVTVAFVHFDEVDALITTAGPAAAAEALDELTRDVQAAADDEGVTFLGSDIDHDGGKVILVGGAPRALGDDEGRVLRALRRVADGDRRLPTRFGVNRGHVFVGEVGPPYRRTYTVMGDTVNLAARLMAKATQGQILATSTVLDHAPTEFEVDPLPPFMVKGKAKPVEALAVGAQGDRRDRAPAMELPFTGRDRELGMLVDALNAAVEGRGGLVDVRGDAGVGKSRLLQELCRHAAGVPVISSYCETYEAKTPYFAARYLVRGVVGLGSTGDGEGRLSAVVNDVAPQLLPWLPLLASIADVEVAPTAECDALEPQLRRDRTRLAVADLLDAVLTTPHVVLVEDGQWIDTLSAELLADLAAAAANRPWLICLLRRDEPGAHRPDDVLTAARISLGPIDDAASRSLVAAATTARPLPPHVRDGIIRQAGGNPLFLEELLRVADSVDSGGELPDSLEALVATQIDRLPAADRRLLRHAAVLGPMVEVSLLGELVAQDGEALPASAIRRLRTFLEPAGPGWLRFRNQCYRQVAYETMAFGRRRELHGRAGAAIAVSVGAAAAERAEILSFHFLHAREFDQCWHHALVAAEQAEAKHANVEAAQLYERALIAAPHLGSSVSDALPTVWESLGDACLAAGMFDRAKLAFGRARRLRSDAGALAQLCVKESCTAMHQGQRSNEVRWIKRGLRLLEEPAGTDLATRSGLHLLYGEHFQRLGRNREALLWCDLAIDDAIGSGDRGALARAYMVRDLAAVGLGRLDDATHLPMALQIWEELDRLPGQASTLTILGAIAYWQGRWDEALGFYERGREAYLRAGDVITAGYDTCNIADILIDQGRGDEAVEGLHEVLSIWRSVRHPGPVAGALLNLGRCALQRGDFPAALDLFEDAKGSAGSVSDATSVEADAWLAECFIHYGEAPMALPLVNAALDREAAAGGTTFQARLLRVRGYALAALGRTDEALADFDRALDVAAARGSIYDRALTLEAVVAVAESTGAPVDPQVDGERRELFARLGVRSTFAPQLAQPADESTMAAG